LIFFLAVSLLMIDDVDDAIDRAQAISHGAEREPQTASDAGAAQASDPADRLRRFRAARAGDRR